MADGRLSAAEIPINFGDEEWRQEVGRFGERSPARIQAESARREIEGPTVVGGLMKCEALGEDGTRLARGA